MTDISISYNYGNGHIVLHGKNFFPCTTSNLKKILKLVNECPDPFSKVKEIYQFLSGYKVELKEEASICKTKFQMEYQKKCDLEHLVKDGRYPNGLPVTKKELKEYKKELKEYKKGLREQTKVVNGLASTFKASVKKEKKVGSNMETLKSLYEGWFDE